VKQGRFIPRQIDVAQRAGTKEMKTRNHKDFSRAPALAAVGFSLATIPFVNGAGFVNVSPMNKRRGFHTGTLQSDMHHPKKL
jgi:hypothetical protein